MALDTVSRVGAASYQTGGAVQTRMAEAAQPVEIEQAQPVMQTVQQTANTGDNLGKQGKGQDVDKDNEKVKKAVSDLNKKMSNTSCQFGVHEGTGRVTIKIVDKETKDIIREYPAEETLEMIEKVWELAGIMVDEKL